MAFDRSPSNSSQSPQASTDAPGEAGSSRWSRIAGPGLIVLAAAVAVAPQLFRGNSCGHDFDIHLVSWFDCLSSWRHGIVYPQWTHSPNYGAGEPRFIFYPPFTWMLGAALGLALPWHLVPIVLTFLLLAATGLATRALALRALPDAPATLAGCAALFSGYALFTAYERSAFGELAGFWIPLLLLLILRNRNPSGSLVRRTFDGSAVPLALVLAGAWLSNAPLGVMASYLLAAVALTVALLGRSWAPILRAAIAAAAGLALSAFYLVPAAFEQRWVDIRQATDDPGLKIENSFLFGHPAGALLELHDIELTRVSLIAVTMVAVAVAGLAVAWRRKSLPADRRWWIPLAFIPLAVFVLQLPVSLPIWNLLPKLRFLQFPWRWLVVLEAPMAIFFAAAVWPRAKARRWLRVSVPAACAAAFLASTAIAGVYFFQPCDDEDAVAPMVQVNRSGAGFEGVDEYAPVGADNTVVATGLPDACLVTNPRITLGILDTPGANPDWWVEQHSCDATYSATPQAAQANPEHLRFNVDLPHAGYLILRLRTYPAWRITLNGRAAGMLVHRDDGLIALPVPQGAIDLTVDWTTTPDVLAGRWLSAFALLLLIVVFFLERRMQARKPARLS
ncbi:MAG TPA: 6-pyruvoyl-tetrahydropterin synthase-related protein [Terracidiphilus sp.]|jgi:hypothetical protein